MTAETMTAMPADTTIHPGWVRVCHWINALAILVMIGSGWQIYNAVQRLLYLGVILIAIVIVLSGLSIWKPVQFQELTALFGGYDFARYVHFVAMAAIVGFLAVHVALALLVPKSLRAMVRGK